MSDLQGKPKEIRPSRKSRARAARIVDQFLAIRDCLKQAEGQGVEVDDLDEVAARLTIAAFKPVR